MMIIGDDRCDAMIRINESGLWVSRLLLKELDCGLSAGRSLQCFGDSVKCVVHGVAENEKINEI